jgi:hypothetical protein
LGEIKSTLDLVLERTKHLSQSSEEKQAQKQKDITNRLNGLLQKYQDRLLSLGQLEREYEALKTEFKLTDHTALAAQVIGRLDPDSDNRALFEVLEHCCQLDYAGLADVIDEYRADYQKAAQSRMAPMEERLTREYLISGSAVVPNLESDEQWHLAAQKVRAGYEEKISREKVNLLGEDN